MSFKIRVLDELPIVGFRYSVTNNEQSNAIFESFLEEDKKKHNFSNLNQYNDNKLFKGKVAVRENIRNNDSDYIIGVVANNNDNSLAVSNIPAGTYLEFDSTDDNIEEMWAIIFEELVPQSSYSLDSSFNFEFYDEDNNVKLYVKVLQEEEIREIYQETTINSSIDHVFNTLFLNEFYSEWTKAFNGQFDYEGIIGHGEKLIFNYIDGEDSFKTYAIVTDFIDNKLIKYDFYEEDFNSNLSDYFERYEFSSNPDGSTRLLVSYNDIGSFIDEHEKMWTKAFKIMNDLYKNDNFEY